MLDMAIGPAMAILVATGFCLFATGRALAAFVSLRPFLRPEALPPRRGRPADGTRDAEWDRIARDGWTALARFRTWSTLAAISSLLLVLSLYGLT
jgi:hypothetical protein